ncbi:MAG: AAA family ATPase [Planctomycetota bacterium]|jgi:ATP-dependent Clp protease ATP-binding subunit ClpA
MNQASHSTETKMFSDAIRAALEDEVVGQPRVVHTVVRGVTRLVSGLMPRERTLCAYLFIGPTGTGKTHLIRSLGRILQAEQRSVVVDCSELAHSDPRMAFAAQVAPLFQQQGSVADSWGQASSAGATPPPLSILHVDYLERGPADFIKVLTAALDTGRVTLPDGSRGSLQNCLIFLTSGLCSAQILDEEPTIGFSGSAEENQGRESNELHQQCLRTAQEQFGMDLIARLDDFEIFHRLQPEHLASILDLRAARVGRWLMARGCGIEIKEPARAYLLEMGSRDLSCGAREFLRAHQELVEFPMADLMVSGRVKPGSTLEVDRRGEEDHLHFTVRHPMGVEESEVVEVVVH